MKTGLDLQRVLGFNLEQNHGSLLLHRNEESFSHRERVAGIENRGRFRPDRDRSRKRLRGQDSPFGVKFQMKLAKNLERVHPRFHAPGFISEQPRAHSRYR